MLTKLTISNFKRLGNVEIELGSPVVFIGPNNSGKTSAMQALALWDIGVKRWKERRSGRNPGQRPGVTVNRRDLVAIPVPNARLLWRDLHVRDVQRDNGQQRTQNVLIDIAVEGITSDQVWTCGMEFDYANEESFYCRPLRKEHERSPCLTRQGTSRWLFFRPCQASQRQRPGWTGVRWMSGLARVAQRKSCAICAIAFSKRVRITGMR